MGQGLPTCHCVCFPARSMLSMKVSVGCAVPGRQVGEPFMPREAKRIDLAAAQARALAKQNTPFYVRPESPQQT